MDDHNPGRTLELVMIIECALAAIGLIGGLVGVGMIIFGGSWAPVWNERCAQVIKGVGVSKYLTDEAIQPGVQGRLAWQDLEQLAAELREWRAAGRAWATACDDHPRNSQALDFVETTLRRLVEATR